MAKSKQNKNRRRRVTPNNAKRSLPTSNNYQSANILSRHLTPLTQFEDRRTYHPDSIARNATSFFSNAHSLQVPIGKTGRELLEKFPSSRVGFTDAKNVLICVRRKQRKEVLHALKKTGKTGQKAPRRSFYSDIQC